jgi:uncharacterized membrane protein YtjA (UPF0391 family)
LLFHGGAPKELVRERRCFMRARGHRLARCAAVEELMLYWAVVFLIVAIIAGVFGFGGIASTAAGIAQVLFFIFVVVFVITLITGLMRRRPPTI